MLAYKVWAVFELKEDSQMKTMSNKEIKKLLSEVAGEIRRRGSGSGNEEMDVLLNLAAVVEHMDPDTLKSR